MKAPHTLIGKAWHCMSYSAIGIAADLANTIFPALNKNLAFQLLSFFWTLSITKLKASPILPLYVRGKPRYRPKFWVAFIPNFLHMDLLHLLETFWENNTRDLAKFNFCPASLQKVSNTSIIASQFLALAFAKSMRSSAKNTRKTWTILGSLDFVPSIVFTHGMDLCSQEFYAKEENVKGYGVSLSNSSWRLECVQFIAIKENCSWSIGDATHNKVDDVEREAKMVQHHPHKAPFQTIIGPFEVNLNRHVPLGNYHIINTPLANQKSSLHWRYQGRQQRS